MRARLSGVPRFLEYRRAATAVHGTHARMCPSARLQGPTFFLLRQGISWNCTDELGVTSLAFVSLAKRVSRPIAAPMPLLMRSDNDL